MTKKQKDENPEIKKEKRKKRSSNNPLVTEHWTDPANNLFLVMSANEGAELGRRIVSITLN